MDDSVSTSAQEVVSEASAFGQDFGLDL